jgi:peptide/nickel transport system substrate-binding protein
MLAACSGATDTSGDGAGQDQPAQTGGNIVFQFPTAPLDLDPSTSQDNNVSMPLWNAWFEYLVRLDPATGKFQPMLAEDWQISEDEKIYTFNLRSDVTFSDGSPMTADDVVFALNRDMEPKISLLHSLLDRIDKISAVNEHTVEIQLKNPWPHLLADLASPTAAIYPEQPLKDAGDKQFFTQQPVGSGPFVLSEVVPNSSYTVRRNAEYWGPRPKLDQITFDVVTDDSARATAVRGGQADIAVAPPPNQLASLENDSTVQVLAFPSARVELIVLNTTKPPFDDPKVRRAFSLALDREAIIESGLFGYAEPASSFLVPPPEATFQNPELQLYP